MQFLFVALGGALGACARYGISLLFPLLPGQWPIATFTANMLGCLCIGACYALVQASSLSGNLKLLIMTGFLGAMTTFSTFALEAWQLLTHNAHLLALSYLLASLLAGIICLAAGHYIGQQLA